MTANGNGNGESMPVVARRLPRAQNEGAKHVEDHADAIARGLPSFIDKDQFCYALMVAANEGDLSKCRPMSVLNAAANAARVGLMPGKTLGLAYFVPFKGEAQLIIGYRGYLDLAFRNRFLKSVHTDVVYRGEEFEYWTDETGPRLKHAPSLDRDVYDKKLGEVAAYCIAHFSSGGSHVRVIGPAQIQKAYRDTPAWNGERHEQVMKTALRRAAKQWKLTSEMALAVSLDEQADLGQPQAAFDLPEGGEAPRRLRTLRDDPLAVAAGNGEPVNANEPDDEEKRKIMEEETAQSAAE